MRSTPWFLSLAISALLAAPSAAQAPLRAGDRIRFTTTAEPGTAVEATIKAIGDTLILESADRVRTAANGAPARQTLMVSRGDLASLEVQRSGRSQTVKGAMIGGGIGAALGLGLGALAMTETRNGFYSVDGGDVATAGLMLGAVGMVLGAIGGASSHQHSWEPVQLSRLAPDLRINTARGTISLGLRVGF